MKVERVVVDVEADDDAAAAALEDRRRSVRSGLEMTLMGCEYADKWSPMHCAEPLPRVPDDDHAGTAVL